MVINVTIVHDDQDAWRCLVPMVVVVVVERLDVRWVGEGERDA